jgi:hypothetical protein
MRAVQKPAHDAGNVFATCIGSIANQGLQARLGAIAATLLGEAADYDGRAAAAQLYTIAADSSANGDVVRGAVTKTELKDVYTSHMVAKSKAARNIYQALLDQAPLGLCPSCGFGHAETLDHYLSKAGFPQFSVLPFNLVPACKSCNHGKLDSVATTAGQQPLHPYYDHGHYVSEQWLYAEIRETSPPTARYFVVPPHQWDDVSKERVAAHVAGFQLSRRFSVQAASELAALRQTLTMFCPTEDSRRARLAEYAVVHRSLHANCWKTALYQALVSSAWYCREGFAMG